MDTAVWRDISLIFLIPQAILIALVPLTILLASVYGLGKLYAWLPGFFAKARAIMAGIHLRVEQVSEAIAAPLIALYALAARLNAWKNAIVRELKL